MHDQTLLTWPPDGGSMRDDLRTSFPASPRSPSTIWMCCAYQAGTAIFSNSALFATDGLAICAALPRRLSLSSPCSSGVPLTPRPNTWTAVHHARSHEAVVFARRISRAAAHASVLRGRFSAVPPARQGADRQRDASENCGASTASCLLGRSVQGIFREWQARALRPRAHSPKPGLWSLPTR
jgi:hypothetical protein